MIAQTPHAVWPEFSERELNRMLLEWGEEKTLAAIRTREALVAQEAEDPFNGDPELEPECWREFNEFLHDPEVEVIALFGGNRTSKSWLAAKRLMQAAVKHRGFFLALRDTAQASIEQLQPIVWHFMPAAWKAQNRPRATMTTAITYQSKSGFVDGKAVLPNGTRLVFATYTQDHTPYEGYEFGSEAHVPCLGVWADEAMTLPWLNMLARRVRFSKAKLLWTFTPVHGLTPAMKEFLGSTPQYIRSKVADLLPAAQLPGLPRGHMPTVAIPWMKKARSVWWHVGCNPFKGYTAQVRENCAGRTMEYVERVAYGYARDVAARAFPLFGSGNVFGDGGAVAE